jgi:flagellar L-ring protein precursor FlgH
MNNKTALAIILMILMTYSAVCSQAGSIWAKRDKNMKEVYADDVARQIGDVLTILIRENGTVGNETKRELSKSTTRSNTFNGELGIKTDNHSILPRIPAFNMSAESGKTLSGNSTFDDTREITDEITVVVEDVLPNGNLVVIGMRQREVAGDKQTIQASGIVRPSDITFGNTVNSEQVANFHLVLINKGVSETYNRVGWLGRILDAIWPF